MGPVQSKTLVRAENTHSEPAVDDLYLLNGYHPTRGSKAPISERRQRKLTKSKSEAPCIPDLRPGASGPQPDGWCPSLSGDSES